MIGRGRRPWSVHHHVITFDFSITTAQAADRHRGWVRRGQSGSATAGCADRRSVDRQAQLSSVSAAALSGGDGGAFAGGYCLSDSADFSAAEKCAGGVGGSGTD